MTTFYRKMCETSGRKFYCRNLNKDIMNLFSMQDDNALALTVKKVLRQDGDCIDNMADF